MPGPDKYELLGTGVVSNFVAALARAWDAFITNQAVEVLDIFRVFRSEGGTERPA